MLASICHRTLANIHTAYSGFFWAGTCFLCVVWIYFRLPEPKGRTYGELDILFEHKVSARKFKGTNVDIFRGDTLAVVESNEATYATEKTGAQPTQFTETKY